MNTCKLHRTQATIQNNKGAWTAFILKFKRHAVKAVMTKHMQSTWLSQSTQLLM